MSKREKVDVWPMSAGTSVIPDAGSARFVGDDLKRNN
jgi:hypothetical protein